jgi:hypothetical protein
MLEGKKSHVVEDELTQIRIRSTGVTEECAQYGGVVTVLDS